MLKNVVLMFILLLLLLQSTNGQMNFVLNSYTVSPNYAKSLASTYTFPFTAYNTKVGLINLNIAFPAVYLLTTASGCKITIDNVIISNTVCSFNSSTNQVMISNIVIQTTFSSFNVVFSTGTARYSGQNTVQFLFYNSSSSVLITNNSQFVNINNAVMPCTLSSNTTIVGAAAIYTVQFIPSVIIEVDSLIQLKFDIWGPYMTTNFNGNSTAVCNSQCTITLLKQFSIQLVIFSGLYTTASSVQQTITLLSVKNPASFKAINLQITVSAKDGSSIYMVGSTTFSATTANQFGSVSFTPSNTAISANNNNINLRIIPKNPIGSNTYLRIIYSPDLLMSFLYGSNNLLTVPNQISGQPSGQILLGNLSRNSSTSAPTLFSLTNFFLTNPPYSTKPASITFRTQQLINSIYYQIDSTVVSIISTASTIISSGLNVNVPNIGSTTTYSLWFITVNNLVIGSYAIITFPTQISISTTLSSCSITTPAIMSTCSILSTTSIKVIFSSNVIAATNITINILQVNNPMTTVPTDSFLIQTFYQDSSTLVDQLTTGLTFTAASVSLKSLTLTPTSTIVYATTSYTFTIQSSFNIPTASTIQITFPNQISNGGQVLNTFTINSQSVSGCTFSSNSNTIIVFNNLCIKSTLLNTSIITITLSNITNPTSYKPTDTFSVQIYNGVYLQQYLTTGIYVTMTQTAGLSYLKANPNSLIVNNVTFYTFQINFLLKHYSGDRVILKYPSEVTLSNTYDCASLTQNLSVSCSKISSQTIMFILNYNSTIYSNNIILTISNFTNIWYTSTISFTIMTTTNDTTYFYQEQGTTPVTYQPAQLSASVNNDNNIVLLSTSKVTVSLTSPFLFTQLTNSSLLSIVIQIPTDLTPISATCIASFASSICSQSSQTFTITQFGDLSSPLTIKFSASTSYFTSSSSFTINLYYNSSLVLTNTQLIIQPYCSIPCQSCTSISNQCLSCLPSPYTTQTVYFSFNTTCINLCPDTYFLVNATMSCSKCNTTACQNCYANQNQCTTCVSGKYLYLSTCLSICPNTYYAYNGQCLQCASPCANCNNTATQCLSCIANYFLDIASSNPARCVLTCTNTNYIGISGTCQQCTSNCLTCSKVQSNCTSCDNTNFQLFSNACIRNCPLGLYSNAVGSCVNCVSPCRTCSSSITCNTCVSNYYLYNNSVCTANCPNGYIQMVDSCATCAIKCATCKVTSSNCTSCPSGTYFYQNDCLASCPALTYPYNKTCTKCITPCVTCTSTPQMCLSCIDGLVLLNTSCVAACPTSGYILEGKVCMPCPSNCLTCKDSITCTLCGSQYNLLQGGCVNVCPVNYPIVTNRNCYQCADVCLTCSTTSDNCTQCKINYYKLLYTCVQSCPLGFYSNVQTFQCQSSFGTKIVFFPILIISILLINFGFISKCISPQTSLPTSLTSFLSLAQLAIWIYFIIQINQPYQQLNMDYILPLALVAVALICLIIINVVFFFKEIKNMEADDYVRGWANNNTYYIVLHLHRYTALLLSFKFFRLIYSRLFNLKGLSLPFRNKQNIFPLTTIMSVICMLFCQIPMLVASFSLVYNKLLKDQMFYTSIQCLIITVISLVSTFIDIFKTENYFQESDFVKTIRYLQKAKDASYNQLEDHCDISKDQGSIEGEKYVSKTGGKFIFSKQDPSTLKQLYFQEQANSVVTDAVQSQQANTIEVSHRKRRINIFDPIKEEDQEMYDELMYKQYEIKTQNKIEEQKLLLANISRQEIEAQHYKQQKSKRGMDLGVNTQQFDQFNDNRSMIQERPLKSKWNNIISHRKELSKSIFNTFDDFTAKQFQKQFIQPILQDQYDDEQYQKRKQDPFRSTEYINKTKKSKRRKRKGPVNHRGNQELEKIYLQRLTEKKQYKDIFASSQSIKYDF